MFSRAEAPERVYLRRDYKRFHNHPQASVHKCSCQSHSGFIVLIAALLYKVNYPDPHHLFKYMPFSYRTTDERNFSLFFQAKKKLNIETCCGLSIVICGETCQAIKHVLFLFVYVVAYPLCADTLFISDESFT